MIAAHPLQWPEGWPRTKPGYEKNARFLHNKRLLTVTDGVSRVLDALAKMGIDRQDVVVSTNVRTRLDGLPRSGEKEPIDKGAAVYWQTRKGERRVMAIDQYTLVADNLAAIAATLDAMRAIERHGGAQILDRAFTGFTALPAPSHKKNWREVMGFTTWIDDVPPADELKRRYQQLSSKRHPDKGGTDEAQAELNTAYAEAKKELGYGG